MKNYNPLIYRKEDGRYQFDFCSTDLNISANWKIMQERAGYYTDIHCFSCFEEIPSNLLNKIDDGFCWMKATRKDKNTQTL